MTRAELIQNIHQGVRNACVEYGFWSGGESIHDRGIESLMTTSVARQIYEGWQSGSKTAYLSLETPFSEVAANSDAPAVRGVVPKPLVGAPRADLVIWNQRVKVTSVLEVKRRWEPSTCLRDLKRLKTLLTRYGASRGGTVNSAFLITMILVNSPNNVEMNDPLQKRLNEINTSCEVISSKSVQIRVHLDQAAAYIDAQWGKAGHSVVIEIAPKRV